MFCRHIDSYAIRSKSGPESGPSERKVAGHRAIPGSQVSADAGNRIVGPIGGVVQTGGACSAIPSLTACARGGRGSRCNRETETRGEEVERVGGTFAGWFLGVHRSPSFRPRNAIS